MPVTVVVTFHRRRDGRWRFRSAHRDGRRAWSLDYGSRASAIRAARRWHRDEPGGVSLVRTEARS